MGGPTETAAAYESYLAARHRPSHSRRTAERWAGFLLPHLRPGMDLLDIGCGPGSITAGFGAAGVEAIGVDLAPVRLPSVERAPVVPVAAADAARLPFPAATFDALFANAVLQHVADPLAVLREARRVARPGAVIGVGDADWGGVLSHPGDPRIDRGHAIREALRPGGDVRVGRALRHLLHDAGFVDITATATCHTEGSAEATRSVGTFEASWFAAPEVVAHVAALGISTPDEMAAIAEAWTTWAESPGAFAARFWVTALARAPA